LKNYLKKLSDFESNTLNLTMHNLFKSEEEFEIALSGIYFRTVTYNKDDKIGIQRLVKTEHRIFSFSMCCKAFYIVGMHPKKLPIINGTNPTFLSF
jgi:hypothetical protein